MREELDNLVPLLLSLHPVSRYHITSHSHATVWSRVYLPFLLPPSHNDPRPHPFPTSATCVRSCSNNSHWSIPASQAGRDPCSVHQ